MNRPPLLSGIPLTVAWVLLIGVALAIRFTAIASPTDLLVTLIPDDAFYYLETAQRILDGQGSTFDGVDRADGYQPLWMGLLTLFAWLPGVAFVRTTLVLGVLLHLIAVIGLARFVVDITQRPLFGWLAGATYLGNGWATYSSFNGLETALASAIFCWLLVLAFRAVDERTATQDSLGREVRKPLPWQTAIPIGAFAGLLFLARTDQVFYGATFLLFVLIASGFHRSTAIRLGTATLVVSLPWFLWHWTAFGHPLPSSGSAQPFILRTMTELVGGSIEARSWVEMRGFFTGRIVDFAGFDRRILVPLLLAATVVIGLALRRLQPTVRRALTLLAGLCIAALLLGFVHSYIRWYPRTWYFDQYIPIMVAFLLISAHQAERLAADLRPIHRFAALVPIATATIVLGTASVAQTRAWNRIETGLYPGQRAALQAARQLDEMLPGDAAVAGWNSGILAFFSERSVLNLDGAISATTLGYLRDRDLTALLCERRVHAIADHGNEINRYRPFLPALDSLVTEPPTQLQEGRRGWIIQPLGQSAREGTCASPTI